MTTSSETLGRRIARLRLAKTATQERLANELNVSPQAVSKWENDINYPDISLLPDLARFLGVSVDELLSGANASAQESASAQKSATEVVSDAADESAEIVKESTEQDNEGIATQSSGFSFGKLFGKSMVKVEKNDDNDGDDDNKEKRGVRIGNGSAKHGLHVYVVSNDGDVVDMCVPLSLAKFVLNSGIQFSGNHLNQETQKQLSNINFDALMEAAKTGESGTLVDITSADGNVVKIWFD
ncbi:helix-turn-helix domain-containing protein [Lancefieldella parvula]|uniref:helix-turn-helix domain-containing protein n=1 Tax=Lancefieldella parvula TaxID=1382 RepID=UPI002910226A|nr:helix-turn-helix domain-containing protein [Lancefieldella parvula]MDU4868108.1 helix-turn-helix domain-containing protein [Lancefieldella parvula]